MGATQRPSVLAQTTPVPNWLLDEAMPLLSDTELRVLLVVVRSTLGWREGAGRKESDWISHRQLQLRTGRSSAAVSRAIDSLVRRGALLITDAVGNNLLTAAQRSRSQGRLHYQLGPMNRNRLGRTSAGEDQAKRGTVVVSDIGQGTLKSKVESRSITALDSRIISQTVALSPDSTSETLPRKVRTTKETKTKEIKKEADEKVITLRVPTLENEVSRIDLSDLEMAGEKATNGDFKTLTIDLTTEVFKDEVIGLWDDAAEMRSNFMAEVEGVEVETGLDITPEMRSVLLAFERAYAVARAGEKPPPLDPQTYTLLDRRLQQHPLPELEAWLPAFFECSFGYVRRRGWSLQSYLESLTVLQTAHGVRHRR